MIGIDTNVLVRFFVNDDKEQATLARRLLLERCTPSQPAYIAAVSLCELAWVLRRSDRLPRATLQQHLLSLVDAAGVIVEEEALVRAALRGAATGGAGFADRLIAELHAAAGVTETLTFDKAAAELDGWRRLR